MSTYRPYFLWLDIETTGLDAEKHRILEVAWQITDSDLEYVGPARAFVIAQDSTFWSHWHSEDVDQYVRDMHTKSGLLSALEEGAGVELDEVYRWLEIDLAKLSKPGEDRPEVQLAGRSIQFDERFLRANDFSGLWADFGGALSHRNFDLRSIKTWFLINGLPVPDEPENAHRALADVLNDIRWARLAR